MELLQTNMDGAGLAGTLAGNWPIFAIIIGAVAVFVIARKSIRSARDADREGGTNAFRSASALASDEDLLAKYPPPGAEPVAPAARASNLDDFFSNSARQQELKG